MQVNEQDNKWDLFFNILNNPDKNIIALDIKIDMLGVGRRNIVKLFEENGKTQDDIDNLLLVNYNVEQLDKIITPEDRIERLFINFCNPWNKKAGHKKHRLTYPKQLILYREFLKAEGEVYFKTDDDDLFEDSLRYFPAAGFEIVWMTRDLHANEPADNLRTEHEAMFSSQGIPIKGLIARMLPELPDNEATRDALASRARHPAV